MTREDKICESCGRSFSWRKKWEDCWEEVKYCSGACRTRRTTKVDRELETVIVRLLDERAADATICPSEAARKVFPDEQWRDRMEQTRRAARRLVAEGKIEIVQSGKAADPSKAKGSIRLRKGRG